MEKSDVAIGENVEIDGSVMEGGGQILRISFCLTELSNANSLRISNIRAGRSSPGLQNQHLANCLAFAKLLNFEILGAKLKSCELFLKKGSLSTEFPAEYSVDCSGAGSIGLVIQNFLPVLLLKTPKNKEFTLKIKGGSIVSFSPSVIYLQDILFPLLKAQYGAEIDFQIIKHGFFPVGGGVAELKIKSTDRFKPINFIERGKLQRLTIKTVYTKSVDSEIVLSVLSKLKKSLIRLIRSHDYQIVNEELEEDFKEDENEENETAKVIKKPKVDIILESVVISSKSNTCFTEVICEFEHTKVVCECLISEKKDIQKSQILQIEDTLFNKVEAVLSNENECLDEFTLDHLIIFMVLAKGVSKVRVSSLSLHSKTALEISSKFLNYKYSIIEKNSYVELEVEGVGLEFS